MSGIGKVVCVTGASGFIASWLVKRLLQRGYTVKATVRDPNDPKKTEHLLTLDGANDRLHLFKADLLEEGSFDSVIEGCHGVFHTASPVVFSVTNPQAELIDPALKGTLNVLRSCSKVSSIKRVVITFSMAAVCYNGKPLSPDVVVDETWFSDPDYCEKIEQWYELSKTLAEEAAWNFAGENAIDLVTLNSGFVIGSLLQPNLNLSVEIVLKLIDGTQRWESYRFVDIRDVADAHFQAYEIQSASGRYCLVGSVVECFESLQILKELYPSLHLLEKCEAFEPSPKHQVSKEKTKSLGISYIPLETSLKDTVESLKKKNFISI